MGEVILKTDIKKEVGYLYYCSFDKKDGTVIVNKAKMQRKGKTAKK